MIYFDLVPELEALRGTGTAFIPHSVRIERSGRSNFFDEPYVEAVHFSNKSCPLLLNPFEDSFTTLNTSRSEVSFFVDPERSECALPAPDRAVTFLNLNEECARSVVAGESVIGLTFEPRCVVVTMTPGSRKELFNDFMARGRPLDDPLRLQINYTVSLENDPDVASASTNCQNSMVMHTNYLSDLVLQDELSELAQVREEIGTVGAEIDLHHTWQDQTRFFQPPSPPPPPPPPPPLPAAPNQVVNPGPPAPPQQVTFDVFIQQLETKKAALEARESALLALIEDCTAFGEGTRDVTCGLSATEAPNPWLSLDGKPCRGNATKSARFGDFCGYWDSSVRASSPPLALRLVRFRTRVTALRASLSSGSIDHPCAVQSRRRIAGRARRPHQGRLVVLCGRSEHDFARM